MTSLLNTDLTEATPEYNPFKEMQKLDIISNSTLITEDSKSARLAPRAPVPVQQHRKISFDDFQTSTDRLFGVFNVEEYKVIRGFIPGRGKRVRLHYTKFQPSHKIASICIMHGYGQQSDDFMEIADYFAKRRYVVHMIDMRGFGYSGGHRVQDSLSELFYDVQALVKCCELNLPAFLLASGMGAMLLVNLLIENPQLPINGVILLTPTLTFPKEEDSIGGALVKYACRQLMGQFLVNSHVNPTGLTKRVDILKKHIDQGLNFQYIKLSILQDVEDATEKMIRDSNRFHYPVIVYCGAENSFQSVESVEKLFSEFSSKDKTFRCFPHGYHCLHLDDECQIIKEETLRWMQERSDRGKFAKLSAFRSVNISRSRVPWSKIIGLVLLLIAAVKMLRYLRVKFSKF